MKALLETPFPTLKQYDALALDFWPLTRKQIKKWFLNHRND